VCIAVIGGMDRLERHYRKEAERSGVELRVFNRSEANIEAKLKHVDALVIFTNKVSHQVKIEAIKAVKARSVPVVLQHSCGVCTFRNCLSCLVSGSYNKHRAKPSSTVLPSSPKTHRTGD
jgi:hypothetical protein